MSNARAMKRIRRAITNALEWNEEAAFAGAGNPDHIDYKREKAKQARASLERIVQEELDRCTGTTK